MASAKLAAWRESIMAAQAAEARAGEAREAWLQLAGLDNQAESDAYDLKEATLKQARASRAHANALWTECLNDSEARAEMTEGAARAAAEPLQIPECLFAFAEPS